MPPKKEVKKEAPKKETKKEQPKKEAPKKEVKKEAPKKEVKKEQPKKEMKKEQPKKEVAKKETKKEQPKKTVAKKEDAKKTTSKKEQPKKEVAKDSKKRKADTTKEEKSSKKVKAVKAVAPESRKIVGVRKPKDFTIGNDLQPKRDLTYFMKWPKYIVMQRKKKILKSRLKVPPVLNQFTKTVNANVAANLFKLLKKYRPEDSSAKKERLMRVATGKATVQKVKPLTVKCGARHVTKLIEQKKCSLVVIAHDVDPIELVLYLPALCRKQDIPYCIVKGKARLGKIVHKKTATCLALKGVNPKDKQGLAQLVSVLRSQYNDKYDEMKRKWGGGVMGHKANAVIKKQLKIKRREERKKITSKAK